MTNHRAICVAIASVWIASACPSQAVAPLPKLGATLEQTTVSGFSSGAYMAGQFAVAYSSIVAGVGLVAGGPYFCTGEPPGEGHLHNALTRCMNPAFARTSPPDAQALWKRTRHFADAGLIDQTIHLARQRVYLFNGRRDHILTGAVTDQAKAFYELAGAAELSYVTDNRAGHGMITDRLTDNACGASFQPFFNNCGIPMARNILRAVAGPLQRPAGKVRGRLLRFRQSAYAVPESGMAADGFVFIPRECGRHACRVHVAFHGCWQGEQAVGDHFYRRAGYNETADANRIIVLYPQVAATATPYNPAGCWDYWGYSGPNFYTRDGAQLSAVRAMLARLAER